MFSCIFFFAVYFDIWSIFDRRKNGLAISFCQLKFNQFNQLEIFESFQYFNVALILLFRRLKNEKEMKKDLEVVGFEPGTFRLAWRFSSEKINLYKSMLAETSPEVKDLWRI